MFKLTMLSEYRRKWEIKYSNVIFWLISRKLTDNAMGKKFKMIKRKLTVNKTSYEKN